MGIFCKTELFEGLWCLWLKNQSIHQIHNPYSNLSAELTTPRWWGSLPLYQHPRNQGGNKKLCYTPSDLQPIDSLGSLGQIMYWDYHLKHHGDYHLKHHGCRKTSIQRHDTSPESTFNFYPQSCVHWVSAWPLLCTRSWLGSSHTLGMSLSD